MKEKAQHQDWEPLQQEYMYLDNLNWLTQDYSQ